MSAYAVALVKMKDPEKFKEYGALAAKTFPTFGGEPIAKGKFAEILSGNMQHDFAVVIRFPSVDKAREWYNSEEYKPCVPVRDEACDIDFVIYQAPEA